ncbi:hypothetical protein LJB42_002874 [Komagataella kurtzmanii]|nr:hypothetical protein LJB42_002874 [Komagataella kurtzmanii]
MSIEPLQTIQSPKFTGFTGPSRHIFSDEQKLKFAEIFVHLTKENGNNCNFPVTQSIRQFIRQEMNKSILHCAPVTDRNVVSLKDMLKKVMKGYCQLSNDPSFVYNSTTCFIEYPDYEWKLSEERYGRSVICQIRNKNCLYLEQLKPFFKESLAVGNAEKKGFFTVNMRKLASDYTSEPQNTPREAQAERRYVHLSSNQQPQTQHTSLPLKIAHQQSEPDAQRMVEFLPHYANSSSMQQLNISQLPVSPSPLSDYRTISPTIAHHSHQQQHENLDDSVVPRKRHRQSQTFPQIMPEISSVFMTPQSSLPRARPSDPSNRNDEYSNEESRFEVDIRKKIAKKLGELCKRDSLSYEIFSWILKQKLSFLISNVAPLLDNVDDTLLVRFLNDLYIEK